MGIPNQDKQLAETFFSDYRLLLQLYFNKYVWLISCQVCFGTDIHFVLRIYVCGVLGACPQVIIDCV